MVFWGGRLAWVGGSHVKYVNATILPEFSGQFFSAGHISATTDHA
jgi:hypothetical protein